jgi:hypothetical protein
MKTIDLFEHPEKLPIEVQTILNKFSECEQTYETCNNLLKALKPHGYTFKYYLDAIPYDLQKVK